MRPIFATQTRPQDIAGTLHQLDTRNWIIQHHLQVSQRYDWRGNARRRDDQEGKSEKGENENERRANGKGGGVKNRILITEKFITFYKQSQFFLLKWNKIKQTDCSDVLNMLWSFTRE